MTIISGNSSLSGVVYEPIIDPKGNTAVSLKFGLIAFGTTLLVALLRLVFTLILNLTISSILASMVGGLLTGTLSLQFLSTDSRKKDVKTRLRYSYILGSIIAGAVLEGISGYFIGGGGGQPPDFWVFTFSFAALLLLAIIIFPIVIYFISSGCSSYGLGITSEIAEEYGESMGEKYMKALFGEKKGWAKRSEKVKDGCNFWIRAIFTGTVSWEVIYIMTELSKVHAGNANDFMWEVGVEFFGTIIAYITLRLFLSIFIRNYNQQ